MITITGYFKYRTKIKIMQDDCNQQFITNRKMLMKALSTVLHEKFENVDKSLKLFSREYEFSDGQISKLLNGKYSDIKFSTLWKLANALNISPIKFVEMIKENLPKDFNFYD